MVGECKDLVVAGPKGCWWVEKGCQWLAVGCWWLEKCVGGLKRVPVAGYGVLEGRDAWWWIDMGCGLDCPKSGPGPVQSYFAGPGPGPLGPVQHVLDLDLDLSGPGPEGPVQVRSRSGPGPQVKMYKKTLRTSSYIHQGSFNPIQQCHSSLHRNLS